MDIFKRLFALGFPTALQMLFEVAIFYSHRFLLAGTLGTNPQAANQIALNLASMTFMIAVGLGVTATIRVGNQKGKANYQDLRRIAFSTFFAGFHNRSLLCFRFYPFERLVAHALHRQCRSNISCGPAFDRGGTVSVKRRNAGCDPGSFERIAGREIPHPYLLYSILDHWFPSLLVSGQRIRLGNHGNLVRLTCGTYCIGANVVSSI